MTIFIIFQAPLHPFMNEKNVEAEFNTALCAFRSGIKTPEPYSFQKYEGRYGIVYERINGCSLLHKTGKNPFLARAASKKMAELHYQIHKIKAEGIQTTQKENLAGAIMNTDKLNHSTKSAILSYLETLPDGEQICHGDFHPDNVLAGDTYWIIDWMTGTKGDPAGDAARTFMILTCTGLPDSVPAAVRPVITYFQNAMAVWYENEYIRISGSTKNDIQKWLLPNYAARLQENLSEHETAVIMQKIDSAMHELKTASA
jgi:aminoglycoside phosphotransferase (APT) family kinase protein